VPSVARISSKINQSSPSHRIFHVQESAAAQANSLPGEARGGREEVVRGLGQAGGAPKRPHTIDHVLAMEAAAARALHRPPPLEGMQNKITILLRSRRIKLHGIWFTLG
jgi:hypothetical protein